MKKITYKGFLNVKTDAGTKGTARSEYSADGKVKTFHAQFFTGSFATKDEEGRTHVYEFGLSEPQAEEIYNAGGFSKFEVTVSPQMIVGPDGSMIERIAKSERTGSTTQYHSVNLEDLTLVDDRRPKNPTRFYEFRADVPREDSSEPVTAATTGAVAG